MNINVDSFSKPKSICTRAISRKQQSEGVTFHFEEDQQEGIASQSHYVEEDEADMKLFRKKIEYLNLPEIKNQPEIEKIEKRIFAFVKNYGEKTEKTTSILMNYLQTVRQNGVIYLKKNDLLKASSYFQQCLRVIDPIYDQIFYEKFLIIKIDAVNKLIYCLLELESSKNNDQANEDQRQFKGFSRYKNAEKILTQFLEEIHQFQKIESLKRSENCMLEVNYFYLGRLHRKNNNNQKAIDAFKQALNLIQFKVSTKTSTKNEEIRNFLHNLRVKIYYKLSKCFRELKLRDMQRQYENMALQNANMIGNLKLEYYMRKKIQFYESKQRFLQKLSRLENKRRIQEQITKLIDQSRQTEIKSLYNIYNYHQFSLK